MEQTNTELTKQDTRVTYGDYGFGQEEDFRAEDLQLPALTLMQSTSDRVKDGTYKAGDIIKGAEKLFDAKERVKIAPLTYYKKWLISAHPNNIQKGQFRGLLLQDGGLSDANRPEIEKTGMDLPFEFKVDGVPHRRTKVVEAYVLLHSELSGYTLPVYLWFRKGAYNRVGKDFMSHFKFAQLNGSAGQLHLLSLGAHERHNDQGDWYEFDVKPAGKLEDEHLPKVQQWYQLIRAGKVNLAPTEDAVEGEAQESQEY